MQFVGDPIASPGQRSSIATSIASTVVTTDSRESRDFRLNATPFSKWAPESGFKDYSWISLSRAVDVDSLQFRILYFVLYWRLIRLDFPAAMTLPP